ncbi:MAG: hypothetical protein K2N87_11235 [Eubacterium sp.]|nr:hypothetical protein [Eubacterium sp.]
MCTESRFSGAVWGGYRWEFLTEQRLGDKLCLEQYGYKTFSQNDEDGIIEEIFRRIGCGRKVFVEFGVEDGLESNCHLLLHKGWSGLWIEGNKESYEKIQYKFRPLIRQGALKTVNAFITKENINDLILSSGISGEVGLLSIDVDGNDYDIWEAVDVIDPMVVVIEYNGKFPPDVDWKMAYDRNHIWKGTDWHGASLKALQLLGEKKEFQLVGTSINGANAFFVKKSLAKGKFYEPATAEALYNPLRLGLIHKNGHPADVCLCGQSCNKGIFDYEEEAVAAVCYGFHPTEYKPTGERYVWSAQHECALLLNGSKIRGGGKKLLFRIFPVSVRGTCRYSGMAYKK